MQLKSRMTQEMPNIERESWISVKEVLDFPRVDWPASPGKFYTVFMVQDSTTGTPETPWLHWLVINVPESTILTQGETVVHYGPPEPEQGTGIHHYLVLVMEQERQISKKEVPFLANFYDPADRVEFNMDKIKMIFAKNSRMGASSFYTSFMDPSPELQAQFRENLAKQLAAQTQKAKDEL